MWRLEYCQHAANVKFGMKAFNNIKDMLSVSPVSGVFLDVLCMCSVINKAWQANRIDTFVICI